MNKIDNVLNDLRQYQLDFVLDTTKDKRFTGPRQVGKTTMLFADMLYNSKDKKTMGFVVPVVPLLHASIGDFCRFLDKYSIRHEAGTLNDISVDLSELWPTWSIKNKHKCTFVFTEKEDVARLYNRAYFDETVFTRNYSETVTAYSPRGLKYFEKEGSISYYIDLLSAYRQGLNVDFDMLKQNIKLYSDEAFKRELLGIE